MVILHTNYGDIHLSLDAEKAPKTVENFLTYVKEGYYDGTLFHRVIDNFMIQGGGFLSGMQSKSSTHPAIENEADNGLPNMRGTIAMARTSDPHSATGQFFINVKDNAFLNHRDKTANDWGYCVFGHVTEGMDVVDKIKGLPTGRQAGHGDVPLADVVIESAQVVD